MLSSQAVIQELLYLVSIILSQYDNLSSEVGALPAAPCWLEPCPPSPRMPKCLCSHTPGCRQQQLLPAEVASSLPKRRPRSVGQAHVAMTLGEHAHKAPTRGRDTSSSLFFFSLVLSAGRSPRRALLRHHQEQQQAFWGEQRKWWAVLIYLTNNFGAAGAHVLWGAALWGPHCSPHPVLWWEQRRAPNICPQVQLAASSPVGVCHGKPPADTKKLPVSSA